MRIDGGRCRETNRKQARDVLRARIAAREAERRTSAREAERRRQVGSGMRGDKVRTVQVQNGTVVDHRTGRRARWARYRRGDLSELKA